MRIGESVAEEAELENQHDYRRRDQGRPQSGFKVAFHAPENGGREVFVSNFPADARKAAISEASHEMLAGN